MTDKTVLNPTVHAELIAKGYTHRHYEADTYDDGDGESGPMIRHEPAYDEYANETEYLFVTEQGIMDREPRDVMQEAWFREQEAKWNELHSKKG